MNVRRAVGTIGNSAARKSRGAVRVPAVDARIMSESDSGAVVKDGTVTEVKTLAAGTSVPEDTATRIS